MEWTNAAVLKLIDFYQIHECLWNPNHDGYKSKTQKIQSWNEISDAVNCSLDEAKRKMDSLLTSFRRERQKHDVDEMYVSQWFAFDSMTFLMEKFSSKVLKKFEETYVPGNDDQQDFTCIETAAMFSEETESKPHITFKRKSFLQSRDSPEPKRFNDADEKICMAQQSTSEVDIIYSLIKDANEEQKLKDLSTAFGEYIATKHRKYSAHTRSVVEHLIGKIIFNAYIEQCEIPHATLEV